MAHLPIWPEEPNTIPFLLTASLSRRTEVRSKMLDAAHWPALDCGHWTWWSPALLVSASPPATPPSTATGPSHPSKRWCPRREVTTNPLLQLNILIGFFPHNLLCSYVVHNRAGLFVQTIWPILHWYGGSSHHQLHGALFTDTTYCK